MGYKLFLKEHSEIYAIANHRKLESEASTGNDQFKNTPVQVLEN